MANNYLETYELYKAKVNYANMLGIPSFLMGAVMKKKYGSNKPNYTNPDSRERAKIAKEIFRNPSSKIEDMLKNYEIMLARSEDGKLTLDTTNIKENKCKVCLQKYVGAFETCPVCTDVYINEFRSNFLSKLNSCDALKIIDGVR
jgi:translation initiation factor 2 beta subunit (eIF-2beta)/eIF-5